MPSTHRLVNKLPLCNIHKRWGNCNISGNKKGKINCRRCLGMIAKEKARTKSINRKNNNILDVLLRFEFLRTLEISVEKPRSAVRIIGLGS